MIERGLLPHLDLLGPLEQRLEIRPIVGNIGRVFSADHGLDRVAMFRKHGQQTLHVLEPLPAESHEARQKLHPRIVLDILGVKIMPVNCRELRAQRDARFEFADHFFLAIVTDLSRRSPESQRIH